MNRGYSPEDRSAKSAEREPVVIPRTVQRRWEAAGEVLRLLHTQPGITRAQAVERLALSSASATELFDRLRGHHLLAESPAPVSGRGRPTTLLSAAADGPLIAVVDLAGSSWRILLADLAGQLQVLDQGEYAASSPARFVPRLAARLASAIAPYGHRVRVVSAAVAGTVTGDQILQFAGLEPGPADLTGLLTRLPAALPLLVGNDATLGGLAEARTGAASGCGSTMHILLTGGIGAVLVIDGHPVLGATGAAGEFGHLPFGDPDRLCPCGAHGCWGTQVDAAAELLPLVESGAASRSQVDAATAATRAFGRGIGALVNAHDPAVVTLGGLGPRLRAAAPEAFADAYQAALMTYRRADPPPVCPAQHQDGPVAGAVSLAIDQLTRPAGLEEWAAGMMAV